jgi:hypothetical protein
VPHSPTQQYNHQTRPHPTHAILHPHRPCTASTLLVMVELWVGVRQVGELVPEPLLLPCAPLPYKEWGYVVLLNIR